MVLIKRGWGVGGRNTARKGFDTSPGGRGERRGVILCWKKEMDVTRQTVMSPRGVPLVLTFPLRLLPSLSGHCCLLLSFNIWSLFSISNTRAPAMTPLLKMPSIEIVFFFLSRITRINVYCEGTFECGFSSLRKLLFSCGCTPSRSTFVLQITANQIQLNCA